MEDNGVKIINSDGSMLNISWEETFTNIVNSSDLKSDLEKLIKEHSFAPNENSRVMIGSDTRDSSPELIEALRAGIETVQIKVKDFGQVTTPQLHFLIWFSDKQNFSSEEIDVMREDEYYNYYGTNLKQYWDLINKETLNYQSSMLIDTADGVGGKQIKKHEFLANHSYFGVNPTVLNDGTGDHVSLNDKCGAESVQKERLFPKYIEETKFDTASKGISFDGDADRIVYFYGDHTQKDIHVIDGDKIAILIGDYLQSMINSVENETAKLSDLITYAVVQAGYANSAATKYLKSKGVHVESTPTGVKYLHHRAMNYDIGLYFEANGHGTMLTKYQKIVQILTDNGFDITEAKINKFLKFLLLTNESVGDAIATMMMLEVVLKDLDISIQQADMIYTDLPSRTIKLPVLNRKKFITEPDNETILIHPEGLQDDILEF